MDTPTLVRTELPGRRPRRGKVRDIFDLGDRLLIVATDRISAFDCVLPDPIPWKGAVLTALSRFWFGHLSGICPHHFLEVVGEAVPRGFEAIAGDLRGRSMLCRKAEVIPIECVARGYLAGSGWAEYQARGTVCGVPLPPGLARSARLPEPIFTPAVKASTGHDENVSFDEACQRVGRDVMTTLRNLTLRLYRAAADWAAARGILLADTKFEFGHAEQGIILIDEVCTPDSSRFWPADRYSPGREPESLDKQPVRDYLQGLCDEGKWDKQEPAPKLPAGVIAATSERYLRAYERLTGRPLPR
jgi:phosphoribosylaminoimidazole-succinocarboxamide synthase